MAFTPPQLKNLSTIVSSFRCSLLFHSNISPKLPLPSVFLSYQPQWIDEMRWLEYTNNLDVPPSWLSFVATSWCRLFELCGALVREVKPVWGKVI